MSKFVTIPSTVKPVNPITYEPIPETEKEKNPPISFAMTVRLMCIAASSARSADLSDLNAIRARVDAAQVGDVIEIHDDEWKALESDFERPNPGLFPPAAMFAIAPHVDAWVHAPSKRAAVMASPAPAAS